MIETSVEGAVGHIVLNAPQRHNALTRDGINTLIKALDDCVTEQCRAILLTGTGRSFCAGAALNDVADTDWTDNPLAHLCDAVELCPLPVICALNGGVYGGGVELALACDFRIGVAGMRLFVPAAELGIHYHQAGIDRTVQRLGAQMARRIFLRAERFEAEALVQLGFLDACVAPEALSKTATQWAHDLAGHAPLAVQGMKQSIVESSRGQINQEAAAQRVAAAFASADHKQRLTAQRNKGKAER